MSAYFKWQKILFIIMLWSFFLMTNQADAANLIGGFVDGKKEITLYFDPAPEKRPESNAFEIHDQENHPLKINALEAGKTPECIKLTLDAEMNIKRNYFVKFQTKTLRLIMNQIYQEPQFFNLNTELGAIFSPAVTTFRLFAPRASAVILKIYKNTVLITGETFIQHPMHESAGGIWETRIAGNLAGKYYMYLIQSQAPDCHPEREVVDPYARVVTRGDGQSLVKKDKFYQTIGRGMIVDLKKTGTVTTIPQNNFDISQAIIYETQMRDFTRDKNSGVADNQKGLFVGAAQKGTRYKDLATGLDHLVELGVNVVQFHPLNEFWVMDETSYKYKFIDHKDEQGKWHTREYYNWGYAPINYFSVEGWYTTNPDDDSRIRDFKKLVSAFHRNGIRVTLDVVFNHTFEGSRENFAHWLFRGIDTDYYYRSFPDGRFCDGIWCGNEVKTENPMVAKYVLDCLKYWVTEFKIDGFRFDWMSALDPETMNRIARELRLLNPNILLYGELWTLRGLSYSGKNNGTYLDRQHVGLFERDYELPPGSIAGFNDYFRDAVKGSGFQRDYAGGYIQNIRDEIYYDHRPFELLKKAIRGMVDYTTNSADKTEWQAIQSPLNSINYISCHDGFTLFDKLILAEYCQYQEPGKPDSPQSTFPQSPNNPQVVDFNDAFQFPAPDVAEKLKKMNKLGAAILLTSQGIPFMHSGEELLRQKIKLVPSNDSPTGELYVFDSNSNTSADAVNAIQWALKEKNADIFHYYQGLIRLRKIHPTFRRATAASVRKGLKFHDEWCLPAAEQCIAYQLLDKENELKAETWKNVIILMNPYPEAKIFQIPTQKWHVVVNQAKAGIETLEVVDNGKILVPGISMMVLHE
jgi:pullulanase